MATYNNFSISRAKGKLYLKQKQPTEGYEEITYGTEGKKTYHKYFGSTKGLPTYFGVKEVQYQGRTLSFLELALQDEGDVINKISVPLKNKGGYTDEVKAIVSALNGYKVGEPVQFTPNKGTYVNKKGETKESFNVYINYQNIKNDEGKGQSTGFIDRKNIPSAIRSDDGMGGNSWDWKPVNVFFFNKIQEIESNFKGNSNSSTTDTQPSNAEPATAVTTSTASAGDDLPF